MKANDSWVAQGSTVIVLVMLIATLSASLGVATDNGAYVSISNVTVLPEQPAPGELTRITTTINNAQSSDSVVEITDVYIRRAGRARDIVRVEDLGTLAIGSTIELPLMLSFDQPGVKNLRLTVVGRTENDTSVRVRYPLTIVVREGGPQVSIDVEDPIVDSETPMNVTITNGEEMSFQQLELRAGGESLRVNDARRVAARLEAGAERSFKYSVTFSDSGSQQVEASLRYRTTGGQVRTAHTQDTVDVDPLREDVGIEATVPETGLTDPPVEIGITNFGNAPITDVAVRVVAGERTVARRSVGSIEPGSTRSPVVNLTDIGETELDVIATYESGTKTGEVRTTAQYISRPARIELTGVDTEWDGEQVTIAGSASNVGLGEANSVVVRVVSSEGVTPEPPNREYFVGTVPPSDFVSFDLTARVNEDVTSIPVEVTYLANGIERTETVSLPIEQPVTDDDDSGGPFDIPGAMLGAIGAVLVVGVVVGIFIGRRSRRVGD